MAVSGISSGTTNASQVQSTTSSSAKTTIKQLADKVLQEFLQQADAAIVSTSGNDVVYSPQSLTYNSTSQTSAAASLYKSGAVIAATAAPLTGVNIQNLINTTSGMFLLQSGEKYTPPAKTGTTATSTSDSRPANTGSSTTTTTADQSDSSQTAGSSTHHGKNHGASDISSGSSANHRHQKKFS